MTARADAPEAPAEPGAIEGRGWQLTYAELIELPDPMAQAIQILKTARSLAQQGVSVHVNARLLRPTDVRAAVRALLGSDPDARLVVDSLFATHKGLAGLQYRARLLRRLLGASRRTVFYGRSRKHTVMLLNARRMLRSKARIVYEFHNIECELAREQGQVEKERSIRADERMICD